METIQVPLITFPERGNFPSLINCEFRQLFIAKKLRSTSDVSSALFHISAAFLSDAKCVFAELFNKLSTASPPNYCLPVDSEQQLINKLR